MSDTLSLVQRTRSEPRLSATLLAFRSKRVEPVQTSRHSCRGCLAQRFCLPEGLVAGDAAEFDGVVSYRFKIAKGSALYHAPQPLISLFAVRVGAFKTTIVDQGGRGQVTGFQMPGDILGLDAIAEEQHTCSAVALEDSEVCVIPYAALQRACGRCKTLQYNFNRILSQLLVREQQMMLLMGHLSAEERLSTFLLGLSERYQQRGYSASGFVLRMSREDISSYLGLRLETVCRCIANLRERGVIECHGRTLQILDLVGLQAAARS